jgi:hypothetical protein
VAKGGVLAAYPARRPGISDHAVGEGKERAAPAAREPPRSAVGARLVPVPLSPQEEDDLPAQEPHASARRPDTSTSLMRIAFPSTTWRFATRREPNRA